MLFPTEWMLKSSDSNKTTTASALYCTTLEYWITFALMYESVEHPMP